MAQQGVPLRQIAGYLGHSEQRSTELYAHHHPVYMAEARAAFDNPLRAHGSRIASPNVS